MNKKFSYIKTIAIVHGKSELILCESIKSNLRLPMEIFSRDSGESSIQIEGLETLLQKGIFKSHQSLYERYPRLERHKKEILPIDIFLIMDKDRCPAIQFEQYKSKELFRKSLFHEMITPVYSSPNLDSIMQSIGYSIDKNDKRKSWSIVK